MKCVGCNCELEERDNIAYNGRCEECYSTVMNNIYGDNHFNNRIVSRNENAEKYARSPYNAFRPDRTGDRRITKINPKQGEYLHRMK